MIGGNVETNSSLSGSCAEQKIRKEVNAFQERGELFL